MENTKSDLAVKALINEPENPEIREKAIQVLKDHPDEQALQHLVDALEDDRLGVRWEASEALASMGRDGLIALLQALTDPDRVGDILLRNGAYRVLEHINVPGANHLIGELMHAIKGPAADIATLKKAYFILDMLRRQEYHG